MKSTYVFQEGYVVDDEFIEIDRARRFQDSLRKSKVVRCASNELEHQIFKVDPEQLLVVKSTIDSPKTIRFVAQYDDEFLRQNV